MIRSCLRARPSRVPIRSRSSSGPSGKSRWRRKPIRKRVEVPRAGGDVEDRVLALARQVLVELGGARERRPGQGRAGERLAQHLPDPLDAGLEDGVVDVGDDAEAGVRAGHPDPDRRAVRLGQAAVLPRQLDLAVLPRVGQRARAELGVEVALAVGLDLDGRVADGDPEGYAGQLVGHELAQAASQRRARRPRPPWPGSAAGCRAPARGRRRRRGRRGRGRRRSGSSPGSGRPCGAAGRRPTGARPRPAATACVPRSEP